LLFLPTDTTFLARSRSFGPAVVLSIFVLFIHCSDSLWSIWMEADFCGVLFIITVNYQEKEGRNSMNRFMSPHWCAFQDRTWIPSAYLVVAFVLNNLKWETVVRFVDISEFLYHQFYIKTLIYYLVGTTGFWDSFDNVFSKSKDWKAK
jgi:hypothetical protein